MPNSPPPADRHSSTSRIAVSLSVAGSLIVVAFFKVPLFAAVPIALDFGAVLLRPFL